MNEYHKIQSIWKRDPATNNKRFLEGQWTLPEFDYLQDNDWEWTEKVDGTNIRIMITNDGDTRTRTVTFGGKTDRAQIPAPLVTWLNDTFLSEEGLARIALQFTAAYGTARHVCLYGEGYGPNIQNGGNYRSDQAFVLFDVRVGDWWLRRPDVEQIAAALDLDVVPIRQIGSIQSAIDIVQLGFKSCWGPFTAEGLVGRPCVPLFTRTGERIITKIKHKDFA